jgi:hypothetical protein
LLLVEHGVDLRQIAAGLGPPGLLQLDRLLLRFGDPRARLRDLGQDDRLGWALSPLLGLMIAQGMLCAIIHGLTPDERWDQRHNAGLAARRTGWGAVIAVIVALLVGATVLMGTIAFGGQKFFEWQLESTTRERR